MRTIHEELLDIQKDFETSIDRIEGLTHNIKDTLKMVEFYSDSKFLTGDKDGLGRPKPFLNLVNGNVDISVVATDIDRKDIQVESDNPSGYDKSFLMRREIYNWMKESKYGVSLNKQGETRARYGGVLVKKVTEKKDGKDNLRIDVVEWRNVLVNPSDILRNPIAEKHFLSPAELSEKKDAWENIDEAIKIFTDKKGKCKQVEIHEITGVLPLSLVDESASEYDYSLQHHFIAVNGKKNVVLFSEELKESPYKYKAWKEVAGRSLGKGVVEEGEQAQVWTNDAVIGEKEAFDLGRKVLFKTTSNKLENNVLTEVDNGHIFKLEANADINILNTISNNLPEFANLIDRWTAHYDRTTNITDALRGETPPSGQAFRLGALVAQQSASSFDYRREDMGNFQEEIFSDWIMPFLEKRMNREHILSSDLFTAEELTRIDESYSISRANNKFKDMVLNSKLGDEAINPVKYQEIQNQFRELVGKTGQTRFFDIPKDYYKDMSKKITINTTNEQKNKMAMLESLSTVFQSVASNPATLQDPTLRVVFNKILELSGAMSPMELPSIQAPQNPTQAPQPPQGNTESPVKEETELNLPGPQAITNG